MSVDDTIKASLERLVQLVEDPDAVVNQVKRRQARRRRRRTAGRSLVAAVSVAVIGVAAFVAGIPGSDTSSGNVVAGRPDPAPGASRELPLGTSPAVTVSASGLGPLRVMTSALREVEDGWRAHMVSIQNTSTETVYVNDHRMVQFLGDREVLAGDEGCGYGGSPGEPVESGCLDDYRPLALEPGAASAFSVTLWRDLQGMNEVTSDTFVFRKPFVYGPIPFSDLDQSGTKGELVLTYEHLDQATGGFCSRYRRVQANRSADVTDPGAIDALVEVLPDELRDDAALFFYPYGGPTSGLDTSGVAAERAGKRLQQTYEQAC